MNELTYKEDDKEIKTSTFLRNRGSCCKTCCRHCPYGYTLKKKGLQFEDYGDAKRELAEKFLAEQMPSISTLAASLLGEGCGQKRAPHRLDNYDPQSLKFILLKERKIGLIVVYNVQVKDLFLDLHYRDQGIDVPIVESYYFDYER